MHAYTFGQTDELAVGPGPHGSDQTPLYVKSPSYWPALLGFASQEIVEFVWICCCLGSYHEELFRAMFKQLVEDHPQVELLPASAQAWASYFPL